MNLNPILIEGCYRWQVYHRLCELGIPCSCSAYQPLIVEINSAIAIVQLWSVVNQITTPRHTQINWLKTCWNCKA